MSAPTPADQPAAAAVVSLNVGHERTILAVSDGNVCQFTRVIEWGGSKLAAAIERDLHVPSKQAHDLLLQLSFDPEQPRRPSPSRPKAPRPAIRPRTPPPMRCRTPARWSRARSRLGRSTTATAPRSPRQLAAAREIALRELQVLARELVSSLQFYQGQPGSLPFAEVLVSGGTSRLYGFAAEVERITRVRLRPADPLTRVQVGDGIADRDDLASLAIAIGLGVED